MTTRRIIGLSLVATAAIWFQVAGRFEASRIDAQRDARLAARTQAASLRVDSERLMSTVTTLADPKFEGRAAGSPGGVAARAWILERYKAIGLQPVSGSYVFPFKFARKSMTGLDGEGANVVGMCLGKDPKLPLFVVSAHYDHLGVRDGVVYPGADDNASGVAVILEVAAYCQKNPFRRSIVFVAFDAEEGGLSGSRAFVATPPVPKERIALNVNLDMVSRSDKREIFIAGTYHTPDLKAPLEEVAKPRADHRAVRSRPADGRRRGRRRLDQPIRPRRVPCGEDPVCVFRRRGSCRLPQADGYRRQDQPRLLRRRRGNHPLRHPGSRLCAITRFFAKLGSDFDF